MSRVSGADAATGAALVVEDDDHMRALLAAMVRDLGFSRTIEVASAGSALSAIACHEIALALIDLCLNGEDGVSLIGSIRTHASPRVHALPIVVVSRAATEARVRAAMSAGADGFIVKPLSTATFQKQVSLARAKRAHANNKPSATEAPAAHLNWLPQPLVFEVE